MIRKTVTFVLLMHALGLVLMQQAAGAARPVKATWEALEHEPAEWLLDAKFGIYTHWGVYSVPAFETEWVRQADVR